jgi:hypothetical protein
MTILPLSRMAAKLFDAYRQGLLPRGEGTRLGDADVTRPSEWETVARYVDLLIADAVREQKAVIAAQQAQIDEMRGAQAGVVALRSSDSPTRAAPAGDELKPGEQVFVLAMELAAIHAGAAPAGWLAVARVVFDERETLRAANAEAAETLTRMRAEAERLRFRARDREATR